MQFAATKQDENGNNKRSVVIEVTEVPSVAWVLAEGAAEELGLILEGSIYLKSKTNAGCIR